MNAESNPPLSSPAGKGKPGWRTVAWIAGGMFGLLALIGGAAWYFDPFGWSEPSEEELAIAQLRQDVDEILGGVAARTARIEEIASNVDVVDRRVARVLTLENTTAETVAAINDDLDALVARVDEIAA